MSRPIVKTHTDLDRDLNMLSVFWFELCICNGIRPTKREMINFVKAYHKNEKLDYETFNKSI